MNNIPKVAAVIVCVLAFFFSSYRAEAFTCPIYTTAQYKAIHAAYAKGFPDDLGYTLAAIVVQESFVGPYIVRINPSDGGGGSYGITHILLSTGMWLEGYTNTWHAKQDLIPMLITDDDYAMSVSLIKLRKYKNRGWKGMVKKYNGTGSAATKYMQTVKKHLTMIKSCYKFN